MLNILLAIALCGAALNTSAIDDQLPVVNRQEILQQRVDELLPRSMERHGIDLWLIFARENSLEPILPTFGLHNTTARSAYLFCLQNGELRKIAIAASYDVTPIIDSGIFDRVISYREEGIKPHLRRVVEELAPGTIAVDTARDVTISDGLTHGMYLYLLETLGEEASERFVSAERLVVSLLGTKLPAEIAALRYAAEATQIAIGEALTAEVITPGETTERDVQRYFSERLRQLGCDTAFCSVVVGPTRGHAPTSDRVIQPGDLIRVDCGARYSGYCADIQRTAYVLAEGETDAPAEIRRFWEVTLRANREAFAAMRPGARGVDVDTAGRRVITGAGFPDFPHGSGHAIGLRVHDVGPYLCPDWPERYGNPVFFTLEPNQVFALEPVLYIDYPPMGGTINIGIEEDVLITEDGAEYFGTPQEDLIIIGDR